MGIPEISIRLEVLPGDSVAEQIANAARFGFDAIALPGRFKDRWLPGLRECMADAALPMAGISLGFEHSLLSANESERRQCRDSLMRLLDLCARLRAPRLNVPPCLIQDNPHRITDAGEYSNVTERCDALLLGQLPAIADAAAERGVTFLLEPVNKYESDYLNSVIHAAELIRRLDHKSVAVTADFFHMQLEELHTGEALEAAASAVAHVHVAENTRVEPGPGSLELQPGFRALKTNSYAGMIEVECRSLSGVAEDVLPASAAYLRKAWSAA